MNDSEYTNYNQGNEQARPGGNHAPFGHFPHPYSLNSNKGKDVLIRIVGSQWQFDDEPTVTRYTTEGRVFEEEDKTVVVYRQSERNGFGQTIATLTLSNDSVTLLWNGNQQMKMTFSEGRRHVSNLTTPEGVISLGIFTSDVKVDREADHGEVHILYAIDAADTPALNTRLEIQYRLI